MFNQPLSAIIVRRLHGCGEQPIMTMSKNVVRLVTVMQNGYLRQLVAGYYGLLMR